MDNRLQATFMPRQAPGANDAYARPKGPPNFLMGIALILFLLAGAAWGGLYFYKDHVIESNKEKKAQIKKEVDNFDPELTKQLSVLKARLDAGKALINNHVAFSKFLEILSANTVQTVQFNALSYGADEEGKISFKLKGQSRTYNAIAFQSDVFSKVSQIKVPVFSGLVLDEKGVINFNVDADLDASAVKYADQFKGEVVLPLPTVPTATTSTSTIPTSPSTSSPVISS